MDELKENIIKELTLDMLNNDMYESIAQNIGIDNFIKLCQLVGGLRIYIPKAETVLIPARNRLICDEYNGFNTNELAKKYGVTSLWLKEIVKSC